MPGRLLGFDIGKAIAQSAAQPKLADAKKHKVANAKKPTVAVAPIAENAAPKVTTMDHFKRPGLARNKHSSEDKSKTKQPGAKGPEHVAFEMVTESPPALFLDEPARSTGALYSLKLHMKVAHAPITLSSMTLKLEAVSTTKKPVVEKCKHCATQVTAVKDWHFISGKTTFKTGSHEFPVSHLIPGHLPVTTHGIIGSIDYRFVARAESEKGQVFELTRPLLVQRAIRPGPDKNSIRVFPPTHLTLNATVPSVIHPLGEINVYAKLSGLTTKNEETQMRWRLRKMDWRIEETETSISPACPKHAAKVGGEGKGLMHENRRVIGHREIKEGWKTDLEAGEVEGEIVCGIDAAKKPCVGVSSPSGLKIAHALVFELVVAEEWAPLEKPKSATPTGVARVLRASFNLTLTERAGMGISWNEEMPPLYEDVPASPPAYLHVRDYDGDDLNEDVDHLRLG